MGLLRGGGWFNRELDLWLVVLGLSACCLLFNFMLRLLLILVLVLMVLMVLLLVLQLLGEHHLVGSVCVIA